MKIALLLLLVAVAFSGGAAIGYVLALTNIRQLARQDGYLFTLNPKIKSGQGFIRIWKLDRTGHAFEPMPPGPPDEQRRRRSDAGGE